MSALSQPATSQRHPLAVAVIGAGMAGRTHANAWRQVGTVFGSEGIPLYGSLPSVTLTSPSPVVPATVMATKEQ